MGMGINDAALLCRNRPHNRIPGPLRLHGRHFRFLVDLSADIEVPSAHVEEKRVSPTHLEETPKGEKILPLIRIHSSSEKPSDAIVCVPYRSSYFWIDDRDLMSKKIFSFLMFVLTLAETGEKGAAPIVTVPTN
jgi:hypothetical protein